MSSQPSDSELPPSVFGHLHPAVQRWVWDKGWTELRDIQAQAIEVLLTTQQDLVIAASTASGKTEAAFLPILSKLGSGSGAGVRALYIGPLKALINDQFQRLEDLAERLELKVTKWHGDASAGAKLRVQKKPEGIVLITPESLEAMFVRKPDRVSKLFPALEFIVIDELHAFLGSERGVQLASLLKRLDAQSDLKPRRIGLSATIGNLKLAAAWLRPGAEQSVAVIESTASSSPLQLQVRSVVESPTNEPPASSEPGQAPDPNPALAQIADHLFRTLRAKGNHLVFAGSRRTTELLSDRLRTLCESANIPNEFFPHHGNLSRDERESVEQRLKEGKLPTTAIATTTLELGIDVGSVVSIAQVGAPASIASLRQRLGRSGRRAGTSSVLRIYTAEHALDSQSTVFDRLRTETVQAVAAVRLLLQRWVEPPKQTSLHLSTLLHQTLSIICERGGITTSAIFKLLGGAGPFEAVGSDLYVSLLRAMHDREFKLIEQSPDGTLMLGELGERITSKYDFYSVFVTVEEYSIVTAGKTLGTLSISNALGAGDFVIFAGRRWRVQDVDDRAKRVLVEPAPAGRVPKFEGEAAPLHDRLVEEMRSVYLDADVPVYLDSVASDCLAEGRQAFRDLGLDRRCHVSTDGRTYMFPWVGTKTLDTLKFGFRYCGLQVDQSRIALSFGGSDDAARVVEAAKQLAETPPSAELLAPISSTIRFDKYDYLLSDQLLRAAFARDHIDIGGMEKACASIVAGIAQS